MRSSVDGDLVSQLHNHRNPKISEIAHRSVLGYGHLVAQLYTSRGENIYRIAMC